MGASPKILVMPIFDFSNVYQYVYQGLKYILQPTKLFKKSQETSQSQNIGSLSGVTYAMVSSF